ncbi:MAG: hypothetical protein ACIPMY_02735 [Rickettsia endosymbiont of Pentastiridius leporinus]
MDTVVKPRYETPNGLFDPRNKTC